MWNITPFERIVLKKIAVNKHKTQSGSLFLSPTCDLGIKISIPDCVLTWIPLKALPRCTSPVWWRKTTYWELQLHTFTSTFVSYKCTVQDRFIHSLLVPKSNLSPLFPCHWALSLTGLISDPSSSHPIWYLHHSPQAPTGCCLWWAFVPHFWVGKKAWVLPGFKHKGTGLHQECKFLLQETLHWCYSGQPLCCHLMSPYFLVLCSIGPWAQKCLSITSSTTPLSAVVHRDRSLLGH